MTCVVLQISSYDYYFIKSWNLNTFYLLLSIHSGKERVFRAIAVALNCKIWASGDKQRTLRCIEDEEITSRLTSDKSARIHVVAMKDIHPQVLLFVLVLRMQTYSLIYDIYISGMN